MKQDDQTGEFLGSPNIYWAQWLVLSTGILFAVACTLFYLVSDNVNYLNVALLTVIIWTGLIWWYSRLREVRMYEDKFIIRNLFGSMEIDRQDYEELQEGILPVIFELKFKGNRTYPFLLSHSTLIRGFLSFNSKEIVERLSQAVDDHFGTEKGKETDTLPGQEDNGIVD